MADARPLRWCEVHERWCRSDTARAGLLDDQQPAAAPPPPSKNFALPPFRRFNHNVVITWLMTVHPNPNPNPNPNPDQVADLIKVNENSKRNLEREIACSRASSQKQAVDLTRLQAEKAKYAIEAAEAQSKFSNALDEVKAREITVLQLQKKIAEGESKLKQQQNLYEAVRSDRNLYAKNQIEAQEEIAEMKRKFKTMTRHIEQLKEGIDSNPNPGP